jgi:hypothetical protein
MAAQTQVELRKFAVKDIYDTKYKDRAVKAMTTAAQSAIGKFAKGSKGYSLDGSLVKLAPDTTGKTLMAECTITISTARGMQSFAKGKYGFTIPGVDKIKDKDIDDICKGAVAKAMDSAIPYIEKNPIVTP